MYASIGTDVPVDGGWSFEPKYDGMRALAFLGPTGVRLMTRNGKDKAAQFPELVLALGRLERKLKLQHRAEFVIGGFTEPRGTRPFLGAILLGYFDAKERLRYVGHAGGGFNREALREMRERLHRLEQDRSPFVETPRANEHAHWVKPKMVVEVKFAEWTSDHRLRQPIFLGVRDDKNAKDVRLEAESVQRFAGDAANREKHKASSRTRGSLRSTSPKQARATAKSSRKRSSKVRPSTALIAQLDQIARAGGDGVLTFGSRKSLHVSSLDKVFFDESGITKGDVMRYYMRVAPVLLPLIDDRPLILKRYPNGIKGQSFFQQNAGISPTGVRVAEVTTEDGKSAQRIIGGDLLTLLYAVQLGMIAVHPWQSRLPSIEFADYSTIDLDPGEGVSFGRVVELAARIRDELEALELIAALKTSGSRGLHIVLPLPPRTSYAQSAALAEAIAARVTAKHPDLGTLERSIRRRPRGTIYVDAKQNARGKSVASAYSVRERAGAPVSAPLRWSDLRRTLRIDDFTIATMPRRLDSIGDLWGEVLKRRNAARTIDRALMNE